MISAKINTNNEIEIDGTFAAGDSFPGLCCQGHDWQVVLVFDESLDRANDSVWGACHNQSCPVSSGPNEDQYRGVKNTCGIDLAEWLIDRDQERAVAQ